MQNQTIQTTAKSLAISHRQVDPQTSIIKLFPSLTDEIWLLEVSNAAPTTGEILPFRFTAAPSEGINYPSIIILLSPSEWDEVRSNRLSLPSGWDLDYAQDL